MKYKFLVYKGIFCFFVSCFFSSNYVLANEDISLGTGKRGYPYNKLGEIVCKVYNSKVEDGCTTYPSGGSVENVKRLSYGVNSIIIAQLDTLFYAYTESPIIQGNLSKHKDVRLILKAYPEIFNVVVRKNSGIKNFNDLKSKRVYYSDQSSGAFIITSMLLQTVKWLPEDSKFFVNDFVNERDKYKMLCDRKIDAIISVTGHKNQLIEDSFKKCDLAFIPTTNSPLFKKLIKRYKFYSLQTIPENLYKGVDSPVKSFGIDSYFATSANFDAETVYNFTKTFYENLEQIKSQYPELTIEIQTKIDPKRSIVPYHEGALRYYKERGWIVKKNWIQRLLRR